MIQVVTLEQFNLQKYVQFIFIVMCVLITRSKYNLYQQNYSTVTLLAKFRGQSTLHPRSTAI